jgi:hypothetical protein
MGSFLTIEQERLGDGFEHRFGRIDLPPLLKPGVPTGADVREHRDLLPAQAGPPSPIPPSQTHIAGSDTVTAGAQEAPELLGSHVCHTSIVRPSRMLFHPRIALSQVVRAPPSSRPPAPPRTSSD